MQLKQQITVTKSSRLKQMWRWWQDKVALAAQSPWYASYLLRRFYSLMHALRPSKQLVASTVTGAALLVGSIAMNPAPAQAATITVNSMADTAIRGDGKCTLREALTNATDSIGYDSSGGDCVAGIGGGSDTITFAGSGTINLTAHLPTSSSPGEDVILQGPGAANLIIDGHGSFQTLYGDHGSLIVNDLTVKGSSSLGVYAYQGPLTVTNSTISGNALGGVGIDGGIIKITNSTVSGNGNDGVFMRHSSLTISNSTVSGNTSNGINTIYSVAAITNSTISANGEDGVHVYANSVTVTGSTISGNSKNGIFTKYASATVTNSAISGNTQSGINTEYGLARVTNSTVADNHGQGVAATFGSSRAIVTNSTISGNSGAGVRATRDAVVTNSTISGNGAGVSVTYDDITIANSTVTGNTGSGAKTSALYGGAVITLTNSLIIGNNMAAGTGDVDCTSLGSGVPTSLVSNGKNLVSQSGTTCPALAGEVTAVPVSSIISPLANNGGNTQTHALVAGSPAIDTGNNADSPGATDQRGFARIVNGTIDIGSVESATTSTGTGSFGLKTALGAIANLFVKNAAQAAALCNNTPLPSGYTFPHGFFEFDVMGVGTGGSTNVTFTLPKALPKGTKIFKCNAANQWVELPNPSDDGDNIITFGLTDGNSNTDQDGIANGVIHDPVGPVVPSAVGGVAEFITPNAASPVTTTGIMATVSALFMGAGAWLMRRR